MGGMRKSRALIDWNPIREAFVQRTPRPSFTELSGEFCVSPQAVSNCASEQGWSVARAEYFSNKLRESGASEAILKAIDGEAQIFRQARELVVQVLTSLQVVVQEVTDSAKSASTRANTLQVVTFAFANLGTGLDRMGLIGLQKGLKSAGHHSAANGSGAAWDKGLMQQINVTVQTLADAGKALPVSMTDVTKQDKTKAGHGTDLTVIGPERGASGMVGEGGAEAVDEGDAAAGSQAPTPPPGHPPA